ncbi:MAG: DUF3307 domain-containing protein [Candidatus Cloacimonetes bacterium]|nr:DUF3307 domain-containing protein [Candidatus Cloacimonadota bacterium]
MLLWRLIFALFVSDFLLQNKWIIYNKHRFKGLATHCGIYLCVMLMCLVDLLSAKVILWLFILAVLHGVVDYAKRLAQPLFGRHLWLLFIGDQMLHGITILLAAAQLSAADHQLLTNLLHTIPPELFFKYSALFIINVFGGVYFTGAAINGVLDSETELDEEQTRASTVIGISERFLITIAVLIGHYELIAFLIAAKSLIRLPEIQNDKTERGAAHFSNYFLVGTFLSYSWALSIAILFSKLFL